MPYIVNGYTGLKNKEKQGKIKIYQPLSQLYIDAYKNGETQEPVVDQSVVNDAAKEADTALVFIGRNSGEGLDRQAVPGDYYLTEEELALVDEAVEAGFAHIVVIYNVGGMVDTSWMKDYPQIDGFVYAWQGGCEGGNSLADVLCGDANPSGKLTDTLAASYDDYPASSDLLEHEDYMEYEEDIYVGYRYFETLAKDEVIYPFGYGLSYTTFEFSTPEVRVEDGKIYIEETITNTGTTAGKEVAQVYFSAPQGKLGKPEKELAAFEKTRELQPEKARHLPCLMICLIWRLMMILEKFKNLHISWKPGIIIFLLEIPLRMQEKKAPLIFIMFQRIQLRSSCQSRRHLRSFPGAC